MLQLPQQIGHIKIGIPIKILLLMLTFYFIIGVVAFANPRSVDPPTDIVLSKDNIDEHCPIGTLIGNLSAVDTDGGTYTWSLVAGAGASGNMSFNIPMSSSSLFSDEIFNFESTSSYSIRVQVEDENNAIFSKSFTISINDIDEANLTTITSLDSEDIDEGNAIGDVVGVFSTTGVHAGTNHTFTFEAGAGDDDNSSFTIDGDQLKAAEVFDEGVQNSYDIRIRSVSQEGDVDIETFTITINSVNNAPTDISLTDNSFEETRSVGYRVGFLSTTDLDDAETYTYSFVTGLGDDDNANFEILSNQFRLATTFDFETQSTHSVRIQTDDGNGGVFEKALTINVEDDPEAPTDITLNINSIDEDNSIGAAIGSFSTEDEDIGDTHTYEILTIGGSSDHTSFTISGDDLQAAVVFDFETQSSYTIRIRTEDAIGDRFTKDFVISINDVVEPIIWDGSAWSNGTGPSFANNVIIDGDYDVATEGSFPSDDLTINSGSTLTIDGNSTVTVLGDVLINGALTVNSGSSLSTSNDGLFIGVGVFHRTTRYADGKYSMVGTPVQQNSSNTADDLGVSANDVYTYNESIAYGADGINRWEIASSAQLVPGQGYAQANKQNLFFVGRPNVGTITVAGTYTEDTDDANEGWNLIANPYTTAIDVGDFLTENTNVTGAIYIWDDNGSNSGRGTNADYIVANGSMATNTTAAGGHTRYNNHIGSAQGFFVKLNSAADTDIDFKSAMRVVGNNSDDNFFRKASLPIVRLNLTNPEGLFKQAVIGFAEDATADQINKTYDAQAFNASVDNGLFTLKAGRTFSLNGMPVGWENIQLQLNAGESGLYTISVELEDYDAALYLRDKSTGDVIDLRNDQYTFSSNAGIYTDRFELISNPSGVLGLEQNEVFIYAVEHTMYIQQSSVEDHEYQLFDMNGKQLLTTKVENQNAEVNLSSLPSGIYLVFDGQKTHKIILK